MKTTYTTSKAKISQLPNNTINYGLTSSQARSNNPMMTNQKSQQFGIQSQGSNQTSSTLNKTKSTTQRLAQPNQIEEDYISNLQKQVYYLELEMKLMKDKEIETKNKVGGYEILFRDGVPLNEHFLALKTKYTNERDAFDALIAKLEKEISDYDNENKFFENETKNSQKNYYDYLERNSTNEEAYNNRIAELRQKVINEKNLIILNTKDKELYSKQLYQINSQNAHINRTIEKNNLFKEDKEEKNKLQKEKLNDKFKEIDKLVERGLLEEEAIKRKYEISSHAKQIEEENSQMIFALNKIDRELHMSQAKINELENVRELNLKYLKDEALNRKIQEKENIKLNLELENLGKLNEENLRVKVKENEQKQLIIIRNKIKNSELKMNVLLSKYKEAEKEARDLLEEKNILQQRLAQLIEEGENYAGKESQLKAEILNLNNAINEFDQQVIERTAKANSYEEENRYLQEMNEKMEEEIKTSRIKLDEVTQRIELNNILKDVDINELKQLTQNNAVVNQSINQLLSKWDKVHSKLQVIESLQQNSK